MLAGFCSMFPLLGRDDLVRGGPERERRSTAPLIAVRLQR
jgi:hypothetical protein